MHAAGSAGWCTKIAADITRIVACLCHKAPWLICALRLRRITVVQLRLSTELRGGHSDEIVLRENICVVTAVALTSKACRRSMCCQVADTSLKAQLLRMTNMALDEAATNYTAYGLDRQLHVPVSEARGWLKRVATPEHGRQRPGDGVQAT